MPQFSFEKYTGPATQTGQGRQRGGRLPGTAQLPLLEIPADAAHDPIRRPGPDTRIVMLEAALVARSLRDRSVPFDRRLSVDHPVAGTEVGAWSLSSHPRHAQYNLMQEGRPTESAKRVHLEPAILGENGHIYFSYRELHHEISADLPPEPVVTLRSLAEGSAGNEQVRYGLARLVAIHELSLPA